MKLYELSVEFNSLLDQLIWPPTEMQLTEEEIQIRLNLFAGQFEYKAHEIGKMIFNMGNDAVSIKQEEIRLAAKRKALENKAEWLEKYVMAEMKSIGITKVKGDILTLTLRDNPSSVQVTSFLDLPEEFVRIVPEQREPDKKAILAHFKETGEIPTGCEVTKSQRLEIK
jgi:hypothetical protein